MMEQSEGSVRSGEKRPGPYPPADAQDAAWVQDSRRGNTLAFNRLVLKWEKPIYNMVLRMLQDPEEAAEVTQEAFMAAYRNIGRFRGEARFSTWMYRIAVNQCVSRLRRRPPGIHYSLDDQESGRDIAGEVRSVPSHEGQLLRDESRARVRDALSVLSPEQKAVVELKFFQELTFEEIAGVVAVPLSTVKSRLYAGLESLKLRLGNIAPAGRTED